MSAANERNGMTTTLTALMAMPSGLCSTSTRAISAIKEVTVT